MMTYKVVLVPFPFDDLSSTKVRPAVLLTEPVGPHRHVVLAFITSQVPSEPLARDLLLDADDPDFSAMGELSPRQQHEAQERIRNLFDL